MTRPSGDPIDKMATTNRNDGFMATRRGQKIDVDGFYANFDWDLGFGTFHTVAGYREQQSRLPNTYTGAVPVKVSGEAISLFDASRDDDRETTQIEMRLASNGDEVIDWVIGGFWQQNDATFCVATTTASHCVPSAAVTSSGWTVDSSTASSPGCASRTWSRVGNELLSMTPTLDVTTDSAIAKSPLPHLLR